MEEGIVYENSCVKNFLPINGFDIKYGTGNKKAQHFGLGLGVINHFPAKRIWDPFNKAGIILYLQLKATGQSSTFDSEL